MMKEKIILAYSGGLDTSCAIRWLQERYNYDVIAVAADVGEGNDLDAIQEKGLKAGALACHIIDAKEIFAEEYIMPALISNALYEQQYPLISALSRPLIAKLLTDIAHDEKAIAVAHGCTGKGNDQVRFDVSFMALNPHLKVVAPVREHPMAREDAIAYAEKHGIPISVKAENPFSIDLNLWGRSCECGILEDPWMEPPEEAYEWTNSLEDTPEHADMINIHFIQGKPIALNGEPMPLVSIIETLNQLAGEHGVGRIDHIENRLVGIKSREVYEAPAAMTLIKAHQALEAITLTRDVAHFKPIMEQRFANLIYEGYWYSPLKDALLSFMQQTQKTVTGQVRMRLHKGHAIVEGRQSSHSLYQEDLATYTEDDAFNHGAAEGFVQLWGLPLKVNSVVNHPQLSEVQDVQSETVGG